MIGSKMHPVRFQVAPPNRARGLLLALLLLSLLSALPAFAENEGTDTPAETNNAPQAGNVEENTRQTRLANRRAASAAKASKRASVETPSAPRKKVPIELEALKDDPNDVKLDWQSKLGASLANLGIAGFWNGVGVTGPVAQLVATILMPIFVLLGLSMVLRKLGSSKVLRKPVKYVEEHHTIMMEEGATGNTMSAPQTTSSPNTRSGPATKSPQTTTAPRNSERVEPSLQTSSRQAAAPNSILAATTAARSSQPLSNQFVNTNFMPSNSQQVPQTTSPAERAQLASASAGAAAKAAMNGKPHDDYGTVPPNFNVAGFIRKTRIYFIRIQIAWDKSDIQNISEITTPDICEEFRRQIVARGPTENITDVLAFDAEVLGVKAVGQKFVVTVKMSGVIRESEDNKQQAFEEIWQMSRAITGKENWLLADIKQY